MVWIALMAAVFAILGHHLGLIEKLSELSVEVAKCPKCTTFWIVFAALILSGCDFVAAIALSMIMAYLSFWAGFLLIGLQRLYDILWERTNRNK